VRRLPTFIAPMLAEVGEPFDSDEFLFEIKWDGIRALAFVEDGCYRLVNRRQIDMTDRYPELSILAGLPAGTVLDGELVVLRDGQPDFGLVQSRHHSRTPLRTQARSQAAPATYVVFDLLYEAYEPLLELPLSERRRRLEGLVCAAGSPRLVLSEGVVGPGTAFFRKVAERGLEGVVAKRLRSTYQPGKRTGAWIKIKRGGETVCAVIGFLPAGKDDFRSLLLAAEDNGVLRCAGKVGTGFDTKMRQRLNRLLWSRLRPRPIVPCRLRAKWVEPGIYCKISYLERTANGEFRAPVFEELYEDAAHG
jgi:DNA ligase D-like protein (predicted ligase)